jgi:NAD(P)-dependent dehydrogenase (short-subunit alcohol dehydrogenase family)
LKNVLVTGAAKRLGRAIALDLAQAGWNVAIHYNGSKADADSAAPNSSRPTCHRSPKPRRS